MNHLALQSNRLLAWGTASAPGACGELAQGMLDGTQVMVTCPIDLFATATVELMEGQGNVHGPADSPKACRAVELTLAYLGRTDLDVRLHLESPLPRSKGMASSTADVLAAIGATTAAIGVQLSCQQQADLALQVEPSDGLMFPGIALFGYRSGSVARVLGQPPKMRVLVLDFGGTVDTVAFNAIDRRAVLRRLEPQFRRFLDLIADGICAQDIHRIGQGATLSALTYQEVLPKPQLQAVLSFARAAGAVGVNVAHSGTILGVLFPDDRGEHVAWAAQSAWERLAGLQAIYLHHLTSGGIIPGRPSRREEAP